MKFAPSEDIRVPFVFTYSPYKADTQLDHIKKTEIQPDYNDLIKCLDYKNLVPQMQEQAEFERIEKLTRIIDK